MRKNQIDAIFIEHANRRNKITVFLLVIFIITILSGSLFYKYINSNNENYITYSEKSDIDYKVYLKENSFFEESFLEENRTNNKNQYIASLINYLIADFEYELAFDYENVEYQYEYGVDARINVYDEDTKNILFSKTEPIINKKQYTTSNKKVNVKELINIDYNYYNELMTKFVNIYDLEDAESILTIDMYIKTVSLCDKFLDSENNNSVISMSIPLTKKTLEIGITNNLINNENKIVQCENNEKNYITLALIITLFISDIIIIICFIRFEIKTRTADTIYTKKLKKILNNYGSYIQEITDDFNLQGCELIKISSFEDLLEIRDTIKQPILMKQNKEKTSTYFIIPSNSKYLYIYRMKLEDLNVKKGEL